MLFSSRLNSIEGIEQAAVMMGTDHNKELMKNSGILTQDVAEKATSNDVFIRDYISQELKRNDNPNYQITEIKQKDENWKF